MTSHDPTSPHAADDLVRFLDAQPERESVDGGLPDYARLIPARMAAVAELPDDLRRPSLLTVAEADGIIELCRRKHCHVGGGTARELRIEKGWTSCRWIPHERGPMDALLAADDKYDSRVRLFARLIASGLQRAARLAETWAIESPSPKGPSRRPKRTDADKLRDEGAIAGHLAENPDAARDQVSKSTGIAPAHVSHSRAWKAHQVQRREARRATRARGAGGEGGHD